MYDPSSDLNSVLKLLRQDQTLKDLMDIGTDLPGKYIVGRRYTGEVLNGQKLLCVYFVPSRSPRNPLTSIEVIQFDAHVPLEESDDAYKIQQRIRQLIFRKTINGHEFWLMGQQGQMTSVPGYVCVGSRYQYTVVV